MGVRSDSRSEPKLDCPVFHAGSSSVKARELAGIADLRAWVLGKTPGAVLKLEDAFHVQTAGGGRAVYQEKVTNLIGGAKFEEYRSDFRSTSWRWVASGVVLLAGLGLLLYYSRREELVGGSAKWGGIRHLGLRILICVGFIALGISHWLVSVG